MRLMRVLDVHSSRRTGETVRPPPRLLSTEQIERVVFGTPDGSTRLEYHHLALWSPTAIRQRECARLAAAVLGCCPPTLRDHPASASGALVWDVRGAAKKIDVWYDVKRGRQGIPDVALHVLKHKKLDTAAMGWGKVDKGAVEKHVRWQRSPTPALCTAVVASISTWRQATSACPRDCFTWRRRLH